MVGPFLEGRWIAAISVLTGSVTTLLLARLAVGVILFGVEMLIVTRKRGRSSRTV